MAATNPGNAVSSTGNAPIKQTGQTDNGQHGSNVNAKAKGRQQARNLKIK